MSRILIPPPRVAVVGPDGRMSAVWYQFFAQFLQGINDEVSSGGADLTSLLARVVAAEVDITALEAADATLQTADAALRDADGDLMLDDAMAPDRGDEIEALRKRVADLEQELSMLSDRSTDINILRRRVADLETDICVRQF